MFFKCFLKLKGYKEWNDRNDVSYEINENIFIIFVWEIKYFRCWVAFRTYIQLLSHYLNTWNQYTNYIFFSVYSVRWTWTPLPYIFILRRPLEISRRSNPPDCLGVKLANFLIFNCICTNLNGLISVVGSDRWLLCNLISGIEENIDAFDRKSEAYCIGYPLSGSSPTACAYVPVFCTVQWSFHLLSLMGPLWKAVHEQELTNDSRNKLIIGPNSLKRTIANWQTAEIYKVKEFVLIFGSVSLVLKATSVRKGGNKHRPLRYRIGKFLTFLSYRRTQTRPMTVIFKFTSI